MCGIAGIFSQKYDVNNWHSVVKMKNAIMHRGPDRSEIHEFKNDPFFLHVGFNRLSIIDQSFQANHPQKVGRWRVWMNGCVYNYQDIKIGLDHQFKTDGDTEAVAALIDAVGIYEAIPKLNGMFVIVAYEESTGATFICRDRYGIKPIYYVKLGDDVIFCSEIKGLLQHPKVQAIPNPSGISQWLTFQNILTDETLFKGIFKLEKGTIWNLNTDHKKKFWNWNFTEVHMGYKSAVDKTRDLVLQAIDRQNFSTPVAWCSGGVDSSIITSHAKTGMFTCGFPEQNFDERPFAEMISKRTGKSHHSVVVGPSSLKNSIHETIYHLEDLRVGPSYSNFILYELTSKFSRVCLQGTGGDELFGGYSWRYAAPDYYTIVNRANGAKISNNPGLAWEKFTLPRNIRERYKFDAEHFLEGVLMVGDKLSMAHGIEDRVPFLDNDLVDFARTIPVKFKDNKSILKDAMIGIVPPQILTRKKAGFTSPESMWFYRMENESWIKNEIGKSELLPQFIRMKNVDRLFTEKNTSAIWSVLALSVWFQIFIEKSISLKS